MKTLLAVAALALAACGGDGLIRVADGGLANVQCKDGTYGRICSSADLPGFGGTPCGAGGSVDPNGRPNGITPDAIVIACGSGGCCRWPDGGAY